MKLNSTEKIVMQCFSWLVIVSCVVIMFTFFKSNKEWHKEATETREWRKSIKKGDTADIHIPLYVKSRVVVDSVFNDTVLIHLVTEKDYLYKIK